MSEEIATAVRAAERRRCAAMLSNDAGALDVLLDPRLLFSHATGAVDDKPAYMVKMAAGRIDYLTIDWSEERVVALGRDAALLSGRMISEVKVEGVQKRLDNRALAAWAQTHGAWRMVGFQSTPLRA